MGYAVQVCFRGTPGVHFIVITVSPSRSSFIGVFCFVILYYVRRMYGPSSECSGRKFSKICLTNNFFIPVSSFVSSLTGKNACFSQQRFVQMYLRSKMACLHLVSFGFLVEFSNSPTLGLLCEMIVVFIENIKLIS